MIKYDPLDIAVLIQKSVIGDLTDGEQARLDRWKAESEENLMTYRELVRAGYLEQARAEHRQFPGAEGYRRFQEANRQFPGAEGYRRFQEANRRARRRKIIVRLTAAAAVVVLSVAILPALWLRNPGADDKPDTVPLAGVIAPKHANAVLTLSDGKQVVLTDTIDLQVREQHTDIRMQGRRLDYSSGAAADILVYNTVTVPRGGEYQLTLADGSQVWLNAESELKYPVAFVGDTCEVFLKGEAYFEVAKNAARSFVVKAGSLDVRVLGTSFDVKTYPDETEQVTLVEGKVEVNVSSYYRELRPGDQLNYAMGIPQIRRVDAEAYTAWKDNRFVFDDDLIGEVVRKLERWYDVEFVIRDAEVRDIRFTGSLPKYRNLDQVLDKLQLTTRIRFVQDGRTIEVVTEK